MLSTTHSSVVVKELEKNAIRMVRDVSSKVESVREGLLETSSMNEINFLSYGDVSEEYHDELYALLETNNSLKLFDTNQNKLSYNRKLKNDTVK